MRIEQFFPSAALLPFVKSFLLIESDQEMDSNTLPDTGLVMALRYKGNVHKIDGASRQSLPASTLTGLRRSARLFQYAPETSNLLVLFKEGGIRAFSKIPAHELFGLSIPAANLFPSAELDELVERLAEANTNPTRIQLMEDFLRGKLCHPAPDLLISKAIQLIHDNNGIIRIKELAATLPVSQDPFEKRFRSQVGTTPKQYSSIVRLRSLIRRYPTCSSLTQAAHAAGYFDQSHFIKDFRLFTGQAPKDFFQSTRYW